ncbi:MAG: Obg family GTPase CgtA, partial [Lachnospiraceae bacterium]|nr:Obg family GTPase CgtA [Lachnospiraceae bacterium]
SNYSSYLASLPQIIAANKTDMMSEEEIAGVASKIKDTFGGRIAGIYPISAVSGRGVKELLYAVRKKLDEIGKKPLIYEREFTFEPAADDGPINVYKDEDGAFCIEGPRIERMLGYTNLESEKGFDFFQKFLKENGILDQLKALGIDEGDTVRIYDLEFDYYE